MRSSWRQSERISCKPRESKAKIRSKTSNFNCMHIPNQLVCFLLVSMSTRKAATAAMAEAFAVTTKLRHKIREELEGKVASLGAKSLSASWRTSMTMTRSKTDMCI